MRKINFSLCNIIFLFLLISCKENHNKSETIDFDKSKVKIEVDNKNKEQLIKEICSDFNVGWKTYDKTKRKYKIVLFDYYGKHLLIYFSDNINFEKVELGKSPADVALSWEINDNEMNKINGHNYQTEKDTTLFWVYKKSKITLCDEKGLIYNRIKLK